MIRQIVKSNNILNLNAVKKLARDTYNTFNGIVNPVNKAGRFKIMQMHDTRTMGASFNKTIVFNIKCWETMSIESFIKNYYKIKNFNNAISTMIVLTIIHELSHLDQDWTIYRSVEELESSNELNVNYFLITHYDEIAKKLNITIEEELYFEFNDYKKAEYVFYRNIENETDIIRNAIKLISNYCKEKLISSFQYRDKFSVINKIFVANCNTGEEYELTVENLVKIDNIIIKNLNKYDTVSVSRAHVYSKNLNKYDIILIIGE